MNNETAALQQQVARLTVENEQLKAKLKTATEIRNDKFNRAVRSRLNRAETKHAGEVEQLTSKLTRRNQTIDALRMQLNERNL